MARRSPATIEGTPAEVIDTLKKATARIEETGQAEAEAHEADAEEAERPARQRAGNTRAFLRYQVPAWLRAFRHMVSKDKDLFNWHSIFWRNDGHRGQAAATDGANLIFAECDGGDFDNTPAEGIILPPEIFAKCKADLDDLITIDYPNFEAGSNAVKIVTATWMQPVAGKDDDGNEFPPVPMSAGIGGMYGEFPDFAEQMANPRGTCACRAVIGEATSKQITAVMADLCDPDREPRHTLRAQTPEPMAPCDVLFPPAAELKGVEIRIIVRPIKATEDDQREWLRD